MIKKIAILGSTGSIGKTTLKIIEKDQKNFKIELLTTNKNYRLLLKQAKKFKVKNIIITDTKNYHIALSKKIKSINIFNDFSKFDKIFPRKIDYVMSSIVGLDGLSPTINIIKHTKTIAIANKEAIICAWNLIKKKLDYHKTKFIPVDSEHFSIWYGIKNNSDLIDKLILTASGGPFLNLPFKNFKKINLHEALKHPRWKMGQKISIDSATMTNKVFEIIEAKNIFNISYKDISILTHPLSYVHSIIKFKNGMIKIIAHDTDMKIPIFNSVFDENNNKIIQTQNVDLNKLNKVDLKKVNTKKFKIIKILETLPKKNSLYETVLVSANDQLVKLFLNRKIKFSDMQKKLLKFLNKSEFKKYKKIQPKNINKILELNKYVRSKISIKSI